MRISSSLVKRILFVCAIIISTTLSVFADENVISSVVISKAKDNSSNYELNIDSSDVVQYKSHIDSDGNVIFDLKNSVLADNLGTIYDDVSNVDNVTVKQLDHNKVRIYVSGKNVKNTELIFVNSLFDTSKEALKKVTINRPISEYKSTHYENDLENQEDIQDWDDNSFNLSHLATTILSELKDGVSGKVLIALLLFTIFAIMFKNLTAKVAQDKEPLIGLNNQKYLDNNYQVGSVEIKKSKKVDNDLPSVASRNKTLRQAQLELEKAHSKYQQYIQNKYQQMPKQKAVEVDNLRQSLALNQYQKSTQNPYKNQEVIRLNRENTQRLKTQDGNFQIPPRPKKPQRVEFSSPYIQRKNNFVQSEIKKDRPKTNMKFLESVTKIYERSGRSDLADGLKNSISKAKETIY